VDRSPGQGWCGQNEYAERLLDIAERWRRTAEFLTKLSRERDGWRATNLRRAASAALYGAWEAECLFRRLSDGLGVVRPVELGEVRHDAEAVHLGDQVPSVVCDDLEQDFVLLRYRRLASHGIPEHALDH
jgi:hypothetical protein